LNFNAPVRLTLAVQALAQATWLRSVIPGPLPPTVTVFNLGAGESAVLAHPGSGAIVDDRAARSAAAALAIPDQGNLGVIILAKFQGLLPAARPVLEQLRHKGMYLSDQLMNRVLAQVGE
jgi:predicted nucleic acid-binding protein